MIMRYIDHGIDPSTFDQAIIDKDSTNWQEAMQSKNDSMYSNQVYTLMDTYKEIVFIGFKWIYKQKLM